MRANTRIHYRGIEKYTNELFYSLIQSTGKTSTNVNDFTLTRYGKERSWKRRDDASYLFSPDLSACVDRLLRFSYICPAHVYNSHCAAGWHLREENDEKEGEREKEGGRIERRRERNAGLREYEERRKLVVGGRRTWRRCRGVRADRPGRRAREGQRSYGIALTFDLIPLPVSPETPCRPLPSVPRAPTLLRNRLECETLATDRDSSRKYTERGSGTRERVRETHGYCRDLFFCTFSTCLGGVFSSVCLCIRFLCVECVRCRRVRCIRNAILNNDATNRVGLLSGIINALGKNTG